MSGAGPLAAGHGLIHTPVMRPPTSFRSVVPLAAIGLAAATLCAAAEVTVPETASLVAIEACERSARQAVPSSAREPVDVTFTAAPTVQPGPAIDGQVVLRGAGRWRAPTGMRTFTSVSYTHLRAHET